MGWPGLDDRRISFFGARWRLTNGAHSVTTIVSGTALSCMNLTFASEISAANQAPLTKAVLLTPLELRNGTRMT